MKTYSWIPNAISLMRMALAVPLMGLILRQAYWQALVLALVAGLSDAADGILAKRFGWHTRLGGIIDPVADKSLLVTAYVALGYTGLAPHWLVALVLGRDLVIVGGALAYHLWIAPLRAAPTYLSKMTTVSQIGLVLAYLVEGAMGLHSTPVAQALLWVTAALTVSSGAHYVWVWGTKAWREA